VTFLEIIIGSPSVFTVSDRTKAIIESKIRLHANRARERMGGVGSTEEERIDAIVQKAILFRALLEYAI